MEKQQWAAQVQHRSKRQSQPSKRRAACDACATSKVRCGKEQPVCARCASSKTPCNYGLSQKCGRVARPKRRCEDSPVSTAILAPRPMTRPILTPLDTTQTTFGTGSSAAVLSTSSAPFMPTSNNDSQSLYSQYYEPSLPSSGGQIEYPSGDWGQSDTPSLPRWGSVSDAATSADYSDFEVPRHQVARDSSVSLDSSQATPVSPLSRERSEHLDGPCHSILRSTLKLLQGDFDKKTTSMVDATLRNNRTALANIAQVLECPCSREPIILFLIASTIAQILHGYRTIGQVEQDAFRLCRGRNGAKGDALHSPLEGQFRKVAVSIGSFTLDEPDQEALSLQVIFGEVKKLCVFVDRWGRRRDTPSAHDENSFNHSSLHGMIISWLQGEAKRALRDTKERLRSIIAHGAC